jgi:ribosomal-protein-alanine N-acetyltransferase
MGLEQVQRRKRPLSRATSYPIESQRLGLRAPVYSDYEAWAHLRRDSAAFLKPWEPQWAPGDLSRHGFRQRLKLYQQRMSEGAALPLFVFRRRDGALIGGVTLSNILRGSARSASLGYWVGEAYARRGFMTEAVGCVVEHAFSTLGLHRVQAARLPENEASARLLARLGFQEEGLAREYLEIAGRRRDHIIHARLASDRGLS